MRSMSAPALPRPGALARAVVALASFAAGCANTNPGVDIQGILVPDEECVYDPTSDVLQLRPILDTHAALLGALPGGIHYTARFLVANYMLNRGNASYPVMADPNVWAAVEAEVELRDLAGAPLADLGLSPRFRVPVSGVVPSATADAPGRGVVPVEVIPSVYGESLQDRQGRIVAAVRIVGTTSGDSTQVTGEYTFPIDLCRGCLFQCVLDTDCLEVRGLSCSPGQDAVSSACVIPEQIPMCTPTM